MSSEQMMQCPYNASHVILKVRMASHLIKCRQQHLIEKYETCPFNGTHDVPVLELQYHIETCPDRKNAEKEIYLMEEPVPVNESSVNIALPSTSENWDEESGCSNSYLNVKEQEMETKKVLRQPVGLSKSKKKEFCQNEVLKFQGGSSKD